MRYKALVSFSGLISMIGGEVRELSDQTIIDDLLKAGYIIPFEVDEKPKEEKPKGKTKGKEKAKNED